MNHELRVKNKILVGVFFAAIFILAGFTMPMFPAKAQAVDFPSTTNSTSTGRMYFGGSRTNDIYSTSTIVTWILGPYITDNTTLCPDGSYMAGLGRTSSNDREFTQVYCASAPLTIQSGFESTSSSTPTGSIIPTNSYNNYFSEVCPDGQYMSGLKRINPRSSSRDAWQIVCSLAPSSLASQFLKSNAVLTGGSLKSGVTKCADGYYMAGLEAMRNRMGGWTTDYGEYTRIMCAPAPRGYLDGLCLLNGSCVSGLQCNSSTNRCENIPLCVGAACNPPTPPPPCTPGTQNCSCDINNACNSGLTCSSGVCAGSGPPPPPPRGGLNQQCYANNTCDGELSCVAGICSYVGCPLGAEWTRTYRSGNGAAYGYAAVTDSSGNIYVTGEQYTGAAGLDAFVIKYNSSGGVLWTKVYDAGGNESGYGVAVDSSGNVYVAGRRDANNGDMLLLKYDANGNLQWGGGRSYDYQGGADIGLGVAADGANIYIAGYRQNSNGSIDAALWRADSNGNISPIATYDNGGRNESANAVAVNSGSVYITGYDQPTATNADMFLRKYNAAGAFQWMQTYDSGNDQADIGKGVAVNSSQKVSVTGYQTSGNGEMFAIENDSTGARQWLETYSVVGATNGASGRAIASYADRISIVGSQNQNNEDIFLRNYIINSNQPYLLGSYISNTLLQEIGYGLSVPLPVLVNGPSGTYQKIDGIYVTGYQSSNGAGVRSSHAYLSAGSYTISLTIIYTDTSRQSITITQSITVYDNHRPTAAFTVTPAR